MVSLIFLHTTPFLILWKILVTYHISVDSIKTTRDSYEIEGIQKCIVSALTENTLNKSYIMLKIGIIMFRNNIF